MAYGDCLRWCGVGAYKCKNIHCSANPNFTPPKHKVKPKQGPGKPARTTRSKIRKDDGKGYVFNFGEVD